MVAILATASPLNEWGNLSECVVNVSSPAADLLFSDMAAKNEGGVIFEFSVTKDTVNNIHASHG